MMSCMQYCVKFPHTLNDPSLEKEQKNNTLKQEIGNKTNKAMSHP